MLALMNIYKPRGPTSYDVIRHLQRRLGRGEKIGHAGTLDPLAEGVLVLCLGRATRLVSLIQAMPKEYVGEVTLGAVSQTDDAEGPISPMPGLPAQPAPPTLEQVQAIVAGFVGEIQQVPPARSAIKVGGKRAYALSRRGQTVELAARPVMIHAISVESYEYPRLTIRVACGGGTYIRSLARDIGAKLGLGGYLSKLVRTRIGPFDVSHCATLDQLDHAPLEELTLPPAMALPAQARIVLDQPQIDLLRMGRPIQLTAPSAVAPPYAGVNACGDLLAVLEPGPGPGQLRAAVRVAL